MTTTFALICEGITDQAILDKIITAYWDDRSEIDINPLQPIRDTTDSHTAPHGGWEKVLEYCEKSVGDALFANDYVVIQIDTDQGDHPNFGINLTDGGKDRPFDELVNDTRKLIISKIDASLHSELNRIVFAICVHSTESWVLLCIFNENAPKNSLNKINNYLKKSNRKPLQKTYSEYVNIASHIKKRNLQKLAKEKHSLARFLTELDGLSPA